MNRLATEKNEIGIVTLYHNNYNFGGLLQAYALPTAVKKYLGISAEQIDYVFEPEEIEIKETSSVFGFIYKIGGTVFNILEKNHLNSLLKKYRIAIRFTNMGISLILSMSITHLSAAATKSGMTVKRCRGSV